PRFHFGFVVSRNHRSFCRIWRYSHSFPRCQASVISYGHLSFLRPTSALLRLALASIQRREIPMEELARLSSVSSAFLLPSVILVRNYKRTKDDRVSKHIAVQKIYRFRAWNFHHAIIFPDREKSVARISHKICAGVMRASAAMNFGPPPPASLSKN